MADLVDIEALVRQGVAVMVATRDGELRPEMGRGWGPSLSDDGGRLRVCVEGSPDSAMARNLESGEPPSVGPLVWDRSMTNPSKRPVRSQHGHVSGVSRS